MNGLDPWWPAGLLAAVLLGDALLSLRPPAFIRDCLDGVRFPREWWWALIAAKLLAVAGLVVGRWEAGVGVAAAFAVVAYFLCATVAHVRARFLTSSFWVNCLGMLGFAVGVLALSVPSL
jgi:hypothetical protein